MRSADQINVLDPRSLADLKRQAREGSPQALAAAAKQFEALFLQMVLKSMRDATPSNGLMDSDQTRMFQSLLDQQLAQNLAQGAAPVWPGPWSGNWGLRPRPGRRPRAGWAAMASPPCRSHPCRQELPWGRQTAPEQPGLAGRKPLGQPPPKPPQT